ncbi:carbon storage regulator CsrA [Curtobacterium sp. MCBA15_001]|uniref:carbon storage regulator CsrA n=1 Tax=Curtobacterium sp. MCBA15_001 TaxID=1898731 RepID=UPI0008DD48C1|nr:carbon storage regulator CsrA [Curtobacterium sp. MCBA15_001]OIH93706.1 carbon storage regulator [Curtobacterium sp. MCBA15_001]
MLVLTRKVGERILIGDDIVITVLDSRGDGVRIGIDAPRGVKIQREEVVRAVTEANVEATQAASADAEARLRAALGGTAPMPTDPPASGTSSAT